MKVTAEMLRKKHACGEKIKVFEEEWPQGAEVTSENCLRAVELELDLLWFAINFLTIQQREEFLTLRTPARDAYYKAIAPAEKAYQRAIAPLLAKLVT